MIGRLYLFFQSRFLKQMMIVMTGTGLAQLLTVLTAPLLGRLYEPADFGLLSLYTSIISVLSVGIGLRYELAICLPKSDEEAGRLLLLSVLVAAGFSAVGLIFLSCGGSGLVSGGIPEKLSAWLWWAPLSLLSIGLFQSLSCWTTRREAYLHYSAAQISRSAVVNISQLSGGLLHQGFSGLLAGQLLGQIAAAAVLAVKTWKEQPMFWRTLFSLAEMKQTAIAYMRFPLYSTPQILLNAVSQNVPTFFLIHAYGSTVVGWYALAHRLIELPLSLLGQSLGQVYYQRAAKMYQELARLDSFLFVSTAGLAACGLLPVMLVLVWGPELFALVLGTQWTEAGHCAQWLAIWLYLGFVNTPSVATAQIYGLQHFLLGYELALTCARILVLFWATATMTAITAIALYSVIGACFNAFLIVYVMVYGKRKQSLQKMAGQV